MAGIPDCNRVFANEYGTTVFLKNVVKAPNIEVGDYTYYDDAEDPTAFEKRCVLFTIRSFSRKNSSSESFVPSPKACNL